MITFIVNEEARTGKGKKVWEQLRSDLEHRKVSYTCYKTQHKGHARELAQKITSEASAPHILIAVGGDGTVNEVLNGIVSFENTCFGVIPVGSGNDYARGLRLSSDPLAALAHILDSPEKLQIDIGCVSWNQGKSRRLFAISSGMGMDAIVCKKALTSNLKKYLNKLHLGKLTYLILTIQTLFSMETTDMTICFPDADSLHLSKLIFLAAMNFRTEGGGVPMAPKANAQDGKLDICTAYGIPKWRTFLLLPLLVTARQENIHGYRIEKKCECRIHADKPMVVHTDGEYCGTFSDIVYSSLEKKLHIIR